MSTASKTTSFPTNIILTAGLSILYVVIAIWAYSLVTTYLLPQKENHSQSVTALVDGTVLINHSIWHPNYSDSYYTTLENEKYQIKQYEFFSNGISLIGEPQYFYENNQSPTRSISISSFLGKEQKPHNWYFIYDTKFQSTGYFVAYHRSSKQIIHYLGQKGFQNSVPVREEQFPIYGSAIDLKSKILIVDENYYGWSTYATIPQVAGNQNFQRDDLFRDSGLLLTLEGTVLQINFLTGKVTPFLERNDILDMTLSRLRKDQFPENWTTSDRDDELVVSFRTPDAVLTYGLQTEKSFQVTIPEELRTKDFTLHYFQEEELLYEVGERDPKVGKYTTDLYWSNYGGTISQFNDDQIVRYYPQDFDSIKWMLASIQPAPLTFLSFMLIAPVQEFKQAYELSTTEAVMKLFQMSLPVVALLLVISIGLLFHYRSFAKHKNVNSHWWEYGFILLMGPFAYLILRWSLKSQPELTPQTQRNNSIEILRPLLKPVS